MTASIVSIDALDLVVDDTVWPFAQIRRAEIDACFEAARRAKPELWNGRILLLHRYAIENGTLRGAFLETDFASLFSWREWGWPEVGIRDCFAAAAIESVDGAFLLGVMGSHTANAGRVYFPCGTPDRDDIAEGRVDLDGSVARELKEETGLDLGTLAVTPGWTLVQTGVHLTLIKWARSAETADVLHGRITAYLASTAKPELSGVRFIRKGDSFTPDMPDFVTAFLSNIWR